MELRLQDLVVRGGSGTACTLAVPAGSVVAVVGPSGAERAGLLLTVAGLLEPAAGSVRLGGAPVTPADAGVVDEDHTLLGGLSAAENVMARFLARGATGAEAWAAVPDLLDSVGLPESSRDNLVEQLSGGQQQRVAVARALAGDPPLLCLDDPLSELDGASAGLVWSRLAEAAGRGAIVLIGAPAVDPPVVADAVLRLPRAAVVR